MKSDIRLVFIVAILAIVYTMIVKIYDGYFAFLIAGIACAYSGMSLNNYIDKRNKRKYL